MRKNTIHTPLIRPYLVTGALLLLLGVLPKPFIGQATSFTLEQVMSYPFPNELTVSNTGANMVWAVNEGGLRNLYAASSPDFEARRLTAYDTDDGQELSSVSISNDGRWVIYVRGGDFGSNWDDALPVNPTFEADPPKVQIWRIPFTGGEPIEVGDGESPVISPANDEIVFIKDRQLWSAPMDGSSPPKKLFHARGRNHSPVYSPDGNHVAFVSHRGDHAFIGVYTKDTNTVRWIAPDFNRDETPRWSPDGTSLVFVRRPGQGGSPEPILKPRHSPWSIYKYHLDSENLTLLWRAPETLRGSYPTTHGRTNLHWAMDHITFLSYHDGWPHLYSIDEEGGTPKILTPGAYMAEYITLSPDKRYLIFCANTGDDALDIDRRHIVRVQVNGQEGPEVLTPGDGLEWTPFISGDGRYAIFISAEAQRPPLPAVMHLATRKKQWLSTNQIPSDFPATSLVMPKQVVFEAPDGTAIHATLFKSGNDNEPKPAIVYVHGGPPRQMLLGWHYSSYYSNAYAMNQYLAHQGYVVLSVNYRLGIGYGYEFHRPPDGGTRGASEYQDILAAGKWLARQEFIDKNRIGIYGGSYGGYLTAMALGRNSDLFATGVDIHGVHDRTINRTMGYLMPDQYERAPDADYVREVAWQSSPVSDVRGWRSPVLIIHGDDDRNVAFSQSTDLVQRLKKQDVDVETMVIVDDTHHFMLHANQLKVNKAVAEYFKRRL